MTRDRPCPAGHVHCQLPWLMAVLMAWLAACGSGAHALTAVQPEGLQSEPAAALGPPTPATPPAPSPIAAVASPAGTPVPAAPDVSFAPPVLLQVGDKRLPAVLVTNRSAEVTSFTIAATWRKDDDTLATAHGAVIDLLPRQTRAANLVIQSARQMAPRRKRTSIACCRQAIRTGRPRQAGFSLVPLRLSAAGSATSG